MTSNLMPVGRGWTDKPLSSEVDPQPLRVSDPVSVEHGVHKRRREEGVLLHTPVIDPYVRVTQPDVAGDPVRPIPLVGHQLVQRR